MVDGKVPTVRFFRIKFLRLCPAGALVILVACWCAALTARAESEAVPAPDETAALIQEADRYFEKIHEDISGLEKAARLYDQVLEKDPGHREARWKLAEVLFIAAMEAKDDLTRKKLYERSLDQAASALSADPFCVPALFYCGCARVSLAEMAGTMSAVSLLNTGEMELAAAMEKAPADRFGILAAVVLSQVKTDTPWPVRDLKEAERLARQAVDWDPNLTMAGAQLATVYWHQKNYEAALAEARRCLDIARPTYMSDAVLWDWPDAREILRKAGEKIGKQKNDR
jgi:tetratricopeptide (TPR) repeat protein